MQESLHITILDLIQNLYREHNAHDRNIPWIGRQSIARLHVHTFTHSYTPEGNLAFSQTTYLQISRRLEQTRENKLRSIQSMVMIKENAVFVLVFQ